jgi:hypothetical protein
MAALIELVGALIHVPSNSLVAHKLSPWNSVLVVMACCIVRSSTHSLIPPTPIANFRAHTSTPARRGFSEMDTLHTVNNTARESRADALTIGGYTPASMRRNAYR